MSERVRDHVEYIADELSRGTDANWCREWHENNCSTWDNMDGDESLDEHLEWCDERPSAGDYLEDALDIEYVVGQDKTYRGARVLVTFGGPNIWIDTQHNWVEGYWWGDEWTSGYVDNLGLDDYLEELYDL